MARFKKEFMIDVATELFVKHATINDTNIQNTASWCIAAAEALYAEFGKKELTR